jgi:hypothetical protein
MAKLIPKFVFRLFSTWDLGGFGMAKVYGIFCDESFKNVLVGTGGTSGKKQAKRKGYHFPGGTIGDPISSKQFDLPALRQQMIVEVEEEFGKENGQILSPYIMRSTHCFFITMDGFLVYFLVCPLTLDMSMCTGDVRDGSTEACDSAFEQVHCVTMENAYSLFSDHLGTGWFGHGLKHVEQTRDAGKYEP